MKSLFVMMIAGLLLTGCGDAAFRTINGDGSLKAGGTAGDDSENGEVGELAQAVKCGETSENKVLMCHVPPGNPDALHTICISRSAVPAHLNRHAGGESLDYLGACDGDDETPDNPENPDDPDNDNEDDDFDA
jgi:hypothetical protein